eukprot:CAMPEP_0167777130 /NCGR_PEP_ID=MMETSP0111_2-20121227/3517_1 /TAXON_ID=91324 /ORGANISM="Lotharella globosa, Strain CCCM811" /LENGTH=69 /DNA_ID=CAMNT_0007667269 /DNA_START=569 /DNA_END=775 /DNA_ORIENTATION=-
MSPMEENPAEFERLWRLMRLRIDFFPVPVDDDVPSPITPSTSPPSSSSCDARSLPNMPPSSSSSSSSSF